MLHGSQVAGEMHARANPSNVHGIWPPRRHWGKMAHPADMKVPMRVLVAEDDPALSHGLERFLRDIGFAVDRVGDGRRAAEALLAQDYDLALLDLGLPGMDGLD